ncbi:hypothetical protein B0J12DRAFT_24435 [Macrophomina phaseolina]|uniref:Uncharacterized protein n=1 Tax=Macrophomina phaseolina TaxID=35725 RepID=A0ABQ8GXJ0_9PEZI|nr:hypothetical protein B0J12DRAFT_24435 [Macrophomina phaseolina]
MHMRRTAYHDTIGRPPWAHAAIVNATQALSRKSSLTTRLACEKRDFRIYIQTPIIFTVIPGHYFITSISTASHPYPSHPGDLAPAAATEILPTCSSGCTSPNVILICLNNLPLSPSPSVVPFLGPSLTCGLSRTTADTFIYNSGAVSHGAKHDHRCHEQYCQPLQARSWIYVMIGLRTDVLPRRWSRTPTFYPFSRCQREMVRRFLAKMTANAMGKIEGPCELAPVRGLKERRHIRMRPASTTKMEKMVRKFLKFSQKKLLYNGFDSLRSSGQPRTGVVFF